MRIELEVSGMTCMHCVARVREALLGRPGVTGVDVRLESGRAVVSGSDSLDVDDLVTAVQEVGYSARPAG